MGDRGRVISLKSEGDLTDENGVPIVRSGPATAGGIFPAAFVSSVQDLMLIP